MPEDNPGLITLEHIKTITLTDSLGGEVVIDSWSLVDSKGNIYCNASIRNNIGRGLSKFNNKGLFIEKIPLPEIEISLKDTTVISYPRISYAKIDNNDKIYFEPYHLFLLEDKNNHNIAAINTHGDLLFHKSYVFPYRKIFILSNTGEFVLMESIFTDHGMVAKIDLETGMRKFFCKRFEYPNRDLFDGNSVIFNIDKDDNALVTFKYQNRIEKFSSSGDLIWSAIRPLNYKDNHKDLQHIIYTYKGEQRARGELKWNTVSYSINSDREGRVWVGTILNQPDEAGIDIFDENGYLLNRIKIEGFNSSSSIYFYQNKAVIHKPGSPDFELYKIITR
ncbi:hypothetical protein ACFL7D_02380 [candidate division KSB1 bacterium]